MTRIWCCLMAAALLGTALVRADAADQEKVLFSEPFDGRLAAGWSWVREDAKAWQIDKGTLVIRTSPGGLWMKDNNNRNLLLRPVPELKTGGLDVDVHVENEPTGAFEHAGLVWYYDDDSYVVLLKEKVGAKVIVQLVSEKEGRPKVGFAEKPYEPKAVWLRMEVAKGKLKGQYRATDKDPWLTLGQIDLPGKGAARVGLITGYGPKDGTHMSGFRKFRILQAMK